MEQMTPYSLKVEHEELKQMLQNTTQLSGKTGEAAKQVAQVLLPHFAKEEAFVLPVLSLLPVLKEDRLTPEMGFAIEMAEKLKTEFPRLLQEHARIITALQILKQTALEEHHPVVSRFTEKLILHAKTEEEILYPAAVLVGEYLKLRLTPKGQKPLHFQEGL